MRIRTVEGIPWIHNDILVDYEDGQPAKRYCGDSWCTGGCNLPALIVPGVYEQKAHSNMVACGNVMQPWRVEWDGTKEEVPEAYRTEILKRSWG